MLLSIAPLRLDARTARRLLLGLAFAALSVVTVVPLWSCEYPPMTDLPQHAAAISILAHHDDPRFHFEDAYAIDLVGRPTAVLYLAGAALVKVLPLLPAIKLTVALAMLSVPFGLLLLLMASGRDPAHALFGFVPLYGTLLHWGFVNYLLAAGLYLVALAALAHDLARPSLVRGVTAAVACVIVFFTHVYGLAILALSAIPMVLIEARGIRGRLRGLCPLVPAGAIGAAWWWLARPPVAESASVELAFEPGRVTKFAEDLAGGLAGPEPVRAVQFAGAGFAAVAVLCLADALIRLIRRRPAHGTSPSWRVVLALMLLPVLHLLLYLTLPMTIGGWWFVYPREAFFVAATLPLLLPALRLAPLRVAAALVALAVAPWPALNARGRYQEFDHFTRGFDAVVARIPRGHAVMALISATRRPGPFSPLIHFGAWAQAMRGGTTAWSFHVFGATPVYHPPGKEPRPLPRRWEWTATKLFRLGTYGHGVDDFLVGHARTSELFAGHEREIEVVIRRGAWAYVRRR